MPRWPWMSGLLALTMLTACSSAGAAVKVHALFSDHAVLQRDMPIPVWGTAADGEKITVTLGDETQTATAENGKWQVKFEPRAAGGPLKLKVTGKDSSLEVTDLLVGEVWLCGGQSNMEWRIALGETPAEIIARAKNPNIRLLTVPRGGKPEPQTEINAVWKICDEKSVGAFSAVGYHFGAALQKHLDIPIGLINSNVGGTPAQRWADYESLYAVPETKGYVKTEGAGDAKQPIAAGSDLYNAMIAPLAPYAIRGVIWYQGESNAGQAERYRTLFPTMIQSWRKAFGQPEMPFLFVQLAPFQAISDQPTESAWAELREAQLMTLSKLRNTGMAVITDIGDVTDIHPKPKRPVGERLALAARAIVYKDKIEYSGPVYESLKIDGDQAVLRFNHIGDGLEAKGDELTGFTIAGEDKVWHNAAARIDGETVIVTSDKVSKPVAVRFGWASYPVVNFWNKDGLPATPFRTDNWPGTTAGK